MNDCRQDLCQSSTNIRYWKLWMTKNYRNTYGLIVTKIELKEY